MLNWVLGVSAAACTTELDCQLSGVCTSGACVCDPGWKGDHCGQLDLLPNAPNHFAYRPLAPAEASETYWNSWGASAPIVDAKGVYHLFSTRILNGCPVNYYTYNEQLVHLTSTSLLGPYVFANVALNTTIINPTAMRAPTGEYVLFYSGAPLPARYNKNASECGAARAASGSAERQLRPVTRQINVAEPPGPPGYTNIGCVLSIASTSDLAEPFVVQLANFTPSGAENLFCRTNPTAFIFPNGTTLLYFRSAQASGGNELIWVARADHWRGPYALVTPAAPIFPNSNEDPFIMRNERGRFILMMHMSHWGPGSNGAKAFSFDGLAWHATAESMSNVWSSVVEVTDGTTVTYSRREEPKIFLDAQGHMRAMFNAVTDPVERTRSYVMSQGIAGPPTKR